MADVKTIQTTPAVADFASTSGSPLLWDSTNVKAYMLADGDVVTQITGAGTGGSALTRVNDTNITLTLGGSPTTALLNAASITAGWTGTLAIARGGTGSATANANTVLAGPTSGGSGTYSFRSLVTADLPAGTGTVTSVNVTTANGVSATGGPITTTGSFTFTLGAINPSSIGQSSQGAISGTTLVGTTSLSTPSIITASGALTVTPAAGSGFNVALSGTGQGKITSASDKQLILDCLSGGQYTSLYFSNNGSIKGQFFYDNSANSFELGGTVAGCSVDFLYGTGTIGVHLAGATSGVVAAGNLGIGQTSPAAKLHVSSGDIAVDGTHGVYSYGVGTPGSSNAEAIYISHFGSVSNIAQIGSVASGTGTVRPLGFFTGALNTGGVEQFEVTHTASATRFIRVTGSNGGNPSIDVSGGSLAITPATIFASTISVTGHTTFEGVTSTGATGTGKLVYDGTPTLVTPNIGAATGTSLVLSGAVTGSNLTVWSTFTPNRTGWTDVGSATVTGRKCKVGNVGYFQVKVVPGVTTATVAGTSYIDLPFTAAGIGGDASMTDLTTFVSVGNCVVDATNSRVYVPAQAATSDSLNISGWFEV